MEQEQKVLDLTARLWNEILKLPVIHPSDRAEYQRDIHDIQNRIAAREYFKRVGGVRKPSLQDANEYYKKD
jgi:hypothetical protein